MALNHDATTHKLLKETNQQLAQVVELLEAMLEELRAQRRAS